MTKMDTSKLPKWAQDHIRNLERERETAIRTLRDFEDTQTKSRISYSDLLCIGERSGPSDITRYVQARRMRFAVGKGYIEVGYNNHGELQVQSDAGVVFTADAHNTLTLYPEDRILYFKESQE